MLVCVCVCCVCRPCCVRRAGRVLEDLQRRQQEARCAPQWIARHAAHNCSCSVLGRGGCQVLHACTCLVQLATAKGPNACPGVLFTASPARLRSSNHASALCPTGPQQPCGGCMGPDACRQRMTHLHAARRLCTCRCCGPRGSRVDPGQESPHRPSQQVRQTHMHGGAPLPNACTVSAPASQLVQGVTLPGCSRPASGRGHSCSPQAVGLLRLAASKALLTCPCAHMLAGWVALLLRRAGRARGFDTFFEQQRRGCNQMLRVRAAVYVFC